MTSKPPSRRGGPRKLGLVDSEGGDAPPRHPVALAIDHLHQHGATPRLVIDARRADVSVPEHVRAKWAERLVIDLDPSYPLDLDVDETGVHASLAFSGLVTRCSFGFDAIYVIVERKTGQVVLVRDEPAAELPEALRAKPPEEEKPRLQAVRASAPPKAEAGPEKSEPKVESAEKATSEAAESPSDAAAKARRAKFRVIDGG